ncbi:TBC1 domain family member 31 [Coccinella septempunctata]|uniref:TBC1 domain family member 31 n=1 Tax=Coccinella septempunctata TaxID=41139 RepID=UPI001D08E913|nr:TBC1 domain family member 31 [Coccinella septempunctata]
MDLGVNTTGEIKKKSFTLNPKPLGRDGLILRVHHTDSHSQRLRFLYTCFNDAGNLLASSDNHGNLFFINIASCKFWGLPVVDSCTLLAFSPFKSCDILIGQKSNEIRIVNFENGLITAKLIGHASPPTNISFSSCIQCLTSSKTEAVIWNLEDNTKLKILTLEEGSYLSYVSFLPNSNQIIGCYTDNLINVWAIGSFEVLRIIPPTTWRNIKLKHFTWSCDGSIMALSGIDPCVAIYSLKAWKVLKFVNLPEYIKTIRFLKFISYNQSTNPILVILSGQGVLLFFDLLENTIISELKTQNEIVKLDHSDRNIFLGCLLCTGEIEIYDIRTYVDKPSRVVALTKNKLKIRLNQKVHPKKVIELKEEVEEMLNIDKLRSILKEYGEYPENYRTMIWEQLLQLPHNKAVYDALIKYQRRNAFENLDREYPIENRSFKSLRCLLNNLVTWCGFFSHVHYLPVFVYPFVRVFQNKPIVCFEAVATILLNWCQYWFEYFPLPPINILAIIESMLLEWDPQLLRHINDYGITSKQYAWPLLECAFSEVLTTQSWYVFWDHILTNEPAFLICTVIGYNIMHRNALFNLKETKEIENFYHKQNPLNMKKFLSKCYKIMDKTNPTIHPRKYLNMFTNIEKDVYPVFQGYPKVLIENESQKLSDLKNQLQNIDLEEAKLLLDKKKQIDKMLDGDLENIEKKRLYEMKKACNEKLQDQQIKAKQHLQRLTKLRKKFDEHQAKILNYSRNDLIRKKLLVTDMMCNEIETNSKADEYLAEKAETMLLRHYSELMRHKMQIEALLHEESSSIDEPQLHETIRREHKKILREVKKISQSPDAENRIRQYNIVSSLLAIDDLIRKVESALAKELSSEYLDLTKSESCLKNIQLRTETEELEAEVSNLLNALSKSRIDESRSKISTGATTNTQSSELLRICRNYPWNTSRIESVSSSESYPPSENISKKESENPKMIRNIKRFRRRVAKKSVRFAGSKKIK